jgi:hypothetical protein
MDLRQKLMTATDGLLAATLAVLVLGSVVAFGGAVWWFPPAVVGLTFLMVAVRLVQLLIEGRMPLLKSPLTVLAVMMLALGMVQLLPLPAGLAQRISPVAHEVYSSGTWSRLVRADDPEAAPPTPVAVRSPATLDRAATLRWLVGAAVCLGIFWTVSHFVDRLNRLYWVWGSVAAGFLLNAALGVVQISGHAEGLFGFVVPERAPAWGPSLDDLLESPAPAALRRLDHATGADRPTLGKVALVPDRPYLFGTLMGGPGALLALGSMALPLGLAILLHVLAPRGSRESLGERLSHSGLGGLAVLLTSLLVAGAFLAGLMAGPWFCLPFAVALTVVGLPTAATPGGRWSAIGLMMLILASLGLGATIVAAWPMLFGGQPPVSPVSWNATRLFWSESLPILWDFPMIGTGFGSFRTIHAYFQTQDASAGLTMSSLMRCGVESGLAGLVLLTIAGLWSAARLPSCLKKVGSADRALAHGLIGAAVGFSLWSILHWTVELPAVAISASALGGTWNRWLAGGTDLFVERG